MFLQYELLSQADPYLSGEVRPIQDRVNYESSNELTSKIAQLKDSIKNLNSLEIKLRYKKSLSFVVFYLETNQMYHPSLRMFIEYTNKLDVVSSI